MYNNISKLALLGVLLVLGYMCLLIIIRYPDNHGACTGVFRWIFLAVALVAGGYFFRKMGLHYRLWFWPWLAFCWLGQWITEILWLIMINGSWEECLLGGDYWFKVTKWQINCVVWDQMRRWNQGVICAFLRMSGLKGFSLYRTP